MKRRGVQRAGALERGVRFGAETREIRVCRALRELSCRLAPRARLPARRGPGDLRLRPRRRRHRRRGQRSARHAPGPTRCLRRDARPHRARRDARRRAVRRTRRRDRAPRAAARRVARSALRLPPGRDQGALCKLRRGARLLCALGQSDRPPAVAPLSGTGQRQPWPRRRDLHRPAADQFLAGHRRRLAQRPGLPSG